MAGTVSLSAPPSTAGTLLAPHLGALYRHHPAIRLRVIVETRIASRRHEVDLAIRLGRTEAPELVCADCSA